MKICRFITVLLMMVLLSSPMIAQDERQYINYFYVKGNVCLPVRVKYSGGEFYVYNNGERRDGFLSNVEAWEFSEKKGCYEYFSMDFQRC